jgi:hypothetical protein
MPEDSKFHTYGITSDGGATRTFRDGELTQTYKNASPAPRYRRKQPRKPGNPDSFIGPKLKVERAKRHIHELQSAIHAFFQSGPYNLLREEDSQTREYVYRVAFNKPIPIQISAIIGDVVHNLRCVLDYLVCDCIRANKGVPDGGSGLIIKGKAKRFKPGGVPKIEGVNARAEGFFLRLKGRKGLNGALYTLHRFDIIDKHNAIVIVASAIVQISAEVGMPMLFRNADGKMSLGGGGPGSQPFMVGGGVPANFRRIFPLKDKVEIYRGPAGLNENLQITPQIAFGQGQVAEGEPVLETLVQLTDFIERVIGVCERRCL